MPPKVPPCPRCASNDLEVVSQRSVPAGGSFGHSPDSPPETIYVFKCKCGVSFTHAVKGKQPQLKPA